jgi:CRISPR-associated endonuclease Cas2
LRYIVAYDISDDLDRERVAARLLSHGVRLQRSVFEIDTSDIDALLDELGLFIDLNRDVVQAFRQCQPCLKLTRGLGQTGATLRRRWWVA